MKRFPFSDPSIEEPEVVHAAFRQAWKAWLSEREAVTLLHAEGTLAPATIRALQEAVAFAEDATFNAVQRYIIAIREAHPALREAQTAVTTY